MKSNLIHNGRLHPAWFRFFIIVLLVLGVFFRFVNLDRKVYWYDETATSLRISGYTWAEQHQLFDHVISIEDLQRYQRINSDKGVIDTIKSLAVEEPQHPPLYFVMARFWVQWFGNSVAVRRSLSAFVSLLVFPCLYWLCLELFESSLVGWVAIALVAVSPFHVLYAQEAREYSLWTVTILLSNAALLRAMRLQTKRSWGIYAATVALGLYTYLFSGLVAIGHAIYVVITESFKLSKTLTAYLLASLAGVLAFAPWIFLVVTHLSQISSTTAWTRDYLQLSKVLKMWLLNLSRIFFDFNYKFSLNLLFLYLLILIVIGYSIYFICVKTQKRVWLFILTLIGSTALILTLPVLIGKGRISTITRYLIPCYLGIHLAVAYLTATQMTSIFVNFRQKKLWRIAVIILTLGGVLSYIVSSQELWWWNKYSAIYGSNVARIVNQANYPLVIIVESSDAQVLAYLFEPKVRIQLVDKQRIIMPNGELRCQPNMLTIPNTFSDIFLYYYDDIPRQPNILKTPQGQYGIDKKQNCKMELVNEWNQEMDPGSKVKGSLWKLKNQ